MNNIYIKKPRPPCIENGVRCTERRAGCQNQCEKYIEYRKVLDEYNAVIINAKKREADTITDDRRKRTEKAKKKALQNRSGAGGAK